MKQTLSWVSDFLTFPGLVKVKKDKWTNQLLPKRRRPEAIINIHSDDLTTCVVVMACRKLLGPNAKIMSMNRSHLHISFWSSVVIVSSKLVRLIIILILLLMKTGDTFSNHANLNTMFTKANNIPYSWGPSTNYLKSLFIKHENLRHVWSSKWKFLKNRVHRLWLITARLTQWIANRCNQEDNLRWMPPMNNRTKRALGFAALFSLQQKWFMVICAWEIPNYLHPTRTTGNCRLLKVRLPPGDGV